MGFAGLASACGSSASDTSDVDSGGDVADASQPPSADASGASDAHADANGASDAHAEASGAFDAHADASGTSDAHADASGASDAQAVDATADSAVIPDASTDVEVRDAAASNVYLSKTRQMVDGFGLATAWGNTPSAAEMDAVFSVTKGAGLSIVRNRVPFREAPTDNDNFMGGGNYNFTVVNSGSPNAYKNFTLNWGNWDLAATKTLIQAIATNPDYQVAHYFSTPWTPPNNSTSKWKLGVADYVNHPEIGGYLDPAHYADYADVLADYALGFQANMGAPLTAISIQNEPNYKVAYESADWSADQFHNFFTVLKTEFSRKGVFTQLPNLKVLAPEDPNFKEDLILPTLADTNTAGVIGIVGAHQYEYNPGNASSYQPPFFTQSIAAGKPIWMTEWSTAAFNDTSIATCLAFADLIHADFTVADLSAYEYWWTPALFASGTPTKVLWTLAQFSRFVRPGWSRVDAQVNPAQNVRLAAFTDAHATTAAIIVINDGPIPETFTLALDSMNFGTITAYRTSATEDLKMVGTQAGGSVAVSVPAQSITTFYAPLTP